MLLRWVLLSFAGISCLAVWAFVIMTVFSSDDAIRNTEKRTLETQITSEKVVKDISTTGPTELVREEEKENEVVYGKEFFKARGIHKGDFAEIAPNGEISIDELLSYIKEDQQ